MRVTIGDVARHAGVSKTTVSRVLNDKGEVEAATALRVREVIERLGYVPSARAVGLALGRTSTVGMLVPSLGWPWMSPIVQGVADVVEARRYGLLLYTCTRGKESLEQFASSVAAHSCDGLLVVVPEDGMPYITRLYERGLPVVVIDDRGFGPALPTVACTNHAGGASAARHLLELGRREPIVLTGRRGYGCVSERLAGFTDVYRSAGLPLGDGQIVDGDFTVGGGRAAMDRLIRSGRRFDAVFAMNDLSAAGVLAGIAESGRTVPGDVAVVGFDDVEVAVHTNPALTTIRQPMREMGATAAGLLLAALAGAPLPAEPTVLPTSLVVRGSTVG
jgi:LacI family transcriptional regulator